MHVGTAAVNAVVDILEPQAFYKEAHGSIFKAIKDLFGDSEPIDLLTVTERLRKEGVLGFVAARPMWPVLPIAWRAPPTWSPTPGLLPRSSSNASSSISSQTIEAAFEDTTDVFDL